MNYLKLNKDIKSIIFNYLTISSNYVRHNYRVNIDKISIMHQIIEEKFENKFMNRYYNDILLNYDSNLYIDITNTLSLGIIISLEDVNIYKIDLLFYYHLGKLKRTYDCLSTIENLGIGDIMQLIRYITLIFVCKKCLSFCHSGNRYLQLCNHCQNKENKENEYKEKNELCCICNEIINDKICLLHCNHYFHINCIKMIKTYTEDFNEYIYCPQCNQICRFIYINDKQFEFDTFLLQQDEDKYYTDDYIDSLDSYIIETDNNNNVILNEKSRNNLDNDMIEFNSQWVYNPIKIYKCHIKYISETDQLLEAMNG